MKKLFLLFAFFICASSVVKAQSFNADSRYVGAAIGLGGGYGIPLSFYYEQGVHKHIGVGATIAYGADSDDDTNFLIGARANYHFLEHIEAGTDWDTYGGIFLGYSSSAGNLVPGVHLGGRYCFNQSWSAFAEIGYGIGVISIGANYSF